MEKRAHPRVSVAPQCKARFTLGGQTYRDIPITNLTQAGCCIQVPSSSAMAGFTDATLLESWALVHPALPRKPIRAKVVWAHPRELEPDAPETTLETGITFLDAPDGYTKAIAKYVTTLSSLHPRRSSADVMGDQI